MDGQLLQRAEKVRVIRAFQGEFGTKLREHVPVAYAMGPGHIIEIEEGEEALYPLATEWRVIPRAPDNTRRGHPKMTGPVKRFIPKPHVVQNVGMPDIVVCPRKRGDLIWQGKVQRMSIRNWPHWPTLVRILAADSVTTFAAGVADASDTSVECPRAWDYARPLDASIEAMLSARLVIATDAGLAHLAVLCGRPLLIVGHKGMPCPDARWMVRMKNYYHTANHTGSPIELIDAWHSPMQVAARALEMMRG